jgi:hypothetical protein
MARFGAQRAYTRHVNPIKEGLINILQWVFIFGASICLLSVIPVTAFRLFQVLFDQSSEEHHGQANGGAAQR